MSRFCGSQQERSIKKETSARRAIAVPMELEGFINVHEIMKFRNLAPTHKNFQSMKSGCFSDVYTYQ